MDKKQTVNQGAAAEQPLPIPPPPSKSLDIHIRQKLALIEECFNELIRLYNLPEGAVEDDLFEDDGSEDELSDDETDGKPLSQRTILIEQLIQQLNGIQAEEDQKPNGYQLIQLFLGTRGFQPTDNEINMLQRLAENSLVFKAHIFKHRNYLINIFAEQNLLKGLQLLKALDITIPEITIKDLWLLSITYERLNFLLWLTEEKLICFRRFPQLFNSGLEAALDKENWDMLRFLLKESPIEDYNNFMLIIQKGKIEAIKIFLESLLIQHGNILNFMSPSGQGPIHLTMNYYLKNTKLGARRVVWLEILNLFVDSISLGSNTSNAAAPTPAEITLLDLGLNLGLMPFNSEELELISTHILKRHPNVKLEVEPTGGLNLLQQCAQLPALIDTAKWLITEQGYDPEIRTASGNTVLLLAGESGNFQLVEAFARKEVKLAKVSKSTPKKGKKSKGKSEAPKKEVDIKAVNSEGRHIGHYLFANPEQIDLLLYLIKSNQMNLLHKETTHGQTVIDIALGRGPIYYPVVYACLSKISTYKQQTQQEACDLFKNILFLKQFLTFFEAHRADKTLAWIFKEMPLVHLIFSNLNPDEISTYQKKFDLDLNLCNPQGETVMRYLMRLAQTPKALVVLNTLLDAKKIDLVPEADIFLMLDFTLSQTDMQEFNLLWSKLPSACCTKYIEQLKKIQLSKLLNVYPEIIMAIVAEVFIEEEKKIAATERATVDKLLQEMTLRVQEANDAEQIALTAEMPFPLCYYTPDDAHILKIILGIMNMPLFKDLNFYIFGSTLYNPTYDDIDILIPDVVDEGMQTLVMEFIQLIKELKYCGKVVVEQKEDGTFGYTHKKFGVMRRVIPVSINDVKFEFICVAKSCDAYAAGLDFTIGSNFFDVKAHTYTPTALGSARTDFKDGIIDTVIDPMESFTLDPSRVLRALRILASNDEFRLSNRCHEAILTIFAKYKKAPMYSAEFAINIDSLHGHLKKMYKKSFDKKNIQLLMDYHVFYWVVGMLSCSTNSLSFEYIGGLNRVKAELEKQAQLRSEHYTPYLFKPEAGQAEQLSACHASLASAK